ncbi:MAG: hypothetical protein COA63_010725 [Methylophaga sp.]|nr:hypothetical protein [Methylophaga sp.]
MRLLKYFLIGFCLALSVGFCTAQAYIIGEIPADSTQFITLENQPVNYDIFNPPQVEVSMFADFSDSAIGNYIGTIWQHEDLAAVTARTGKEFPEMEAVNKYVSFIIEQADKPIIYLPPLPDGSVDPNATVVSFSWGWRYARLITDATIEECSVVDYYTDSGTSKAQLLGVIKQFDNLVSSGNDAGKVLRSVADLYGKVEEVKNELSVIDNIVRDTK